MSLCLVFEVMTNQQKSKDLSLNPISVFGLTLLMALALGWSSFNYGGTKVAVSQDGDCLEIMPSDAALQPDQLKQLDDRKEASRQDIHRFLGRPYCSLPKVTIRFQTITEREVYVTSQNNRVILAYENNRFIGYSFLPQRPIHRSQVELELRPWMGVQSGEHISGRPVITGLGEISLKSSEEVYAPANGRVETDFVFISGGTLSPSREDCLLFSSALFPTYITQLCGLKNRYPGSVQQNNGIGATNGQLNVALLSWRQDGGRGRNWMFVSPSPDFLKGFFRP